MALKGSKTADNLAAAFAGESQANRRYLYFAAKADVEGAPDVAAVRGEDLLAYLNLLVTWMSTHTHTSSSPGSPSSPPTAPPPSPPSSMLSQSLRIQ